MQDPGANKSDLQLFHHRNVQIIWIIKRNKNKHFSVGYIINNTNNSPLNIMGEQ